MAVYCYHDRHGNRVSQQADRVTIQCGCLVFYGPSALDVLACVAAGEWKCLLKAGDRKNYLYINTGCKFQGKPILLESSGDSDQD